MLGQLSRKWIVAFFYLDLYEPGGMWCFLVGFVRRQVLSATHSYGGRLHRLVISPKAKISVVAGCPKSFFGGGGSK